MLETQLTACAVPPTPAVYRSLVGVFPDQDIVNYLRTRGIVGPIEQSFVGEMAWSMMGVGFAEALRETSLYPETRAGHEQFFAEFLAMNPAAPVDEELPVAIVTRRAIALVKGRLASGQHADPQQQWRALLDRFEAAEALDVSRLPLAEQDDAFDAAGDALDAVMAFPAPDADAARWKLDWFFADGGGTHTAVWSKDFLAQMFADYRRFLVPASSKAGAA